MKIREFYARLPLTYSFEVFPPKTDDEIRKLYDTIAELKAWGPRFVSVTFRPDRSQRDKTFQIAAHVKHNLGIESMAHLTCVAATEDQICQDLDMARVLGLENILALSGDPPKGSTQSVAGERTLRYASQLVALIKQRSDFGIGVAGHPEGHSECRDRDKVLRDLQRKVDAGAEFVITQLFFDSRYFYEYVERARKLGIHISIIPGILPILSTAQVKRFTALSGATLPPSLERDLERLAGDDTAVQKLGVDYATQQCLDLLEQGVPGIHFYCLNRSASVKAIFKNLGPRWTIAQPTDNPSVSRSRGPDDPMLRDS